MNRVYNGKPDGSAGFIPTSTGGAVTPLKPNPRDINIKDIARGLSNQCRWSGQLRTFYSVAEHSLWTSYIVPGKWAREALLHDAAEAYCNDICRPVKTELKMYKTIEEGLMKAICIRFGLLNLESWPKCIKFADNDVANNEIRDLVVNGSERYPTCLPAVNYIDLTGVRMTPHVAERAFLERWEKLMEIMNVKF